MDSGNTGSAISLPAKSNVVVLGTVRKAVRMLASVRAGIRRGAGRKAAAASTAGRARDIVEAVEATVQATVPVEDTAPAEFSFLLFRDRQRLETAERERHQ